MREVNTQGTAAQNGKNKQTNKKKKTGTYRNSQLIATDL